MRHPREATRSIGCTPHSLPILVAYTRQWGKDTRCLMHIRDSTASQGALAQWHRDSLRPAPCMWLHQSSADAAHPVVRSYAAGGTVHSAPWAPARRRSRGSPRRRSSS